MKVHSWILTIPLVFCAFGLYAADANKEIYGNDDRLDLYEVADTDIVAWSKSVCVFIPTGYLSQREDGKYAVDVAAAAAHAWPLCDDQRFSSQPMPGTCTGFLIGEDLIASAGHCVIEKNEGPYADLSGFYIVFGFDMLDEDTAITVFDSSQVYTIKGVVSAALSLSKDEDYSLLRLDRPVEIADAEPLELRASGAIQNGDPVGIIGHPLGLPKKAAFGADTVVYPVPNDSEDPATNTFFTNFDGSGGNSGSPVFNQTTGLVEGIYVYSFVDDTIRVNGECDQLNVVANDAAAQGVFKITSILTQVDNALAATGEGEVFDNVDDDLLIPFLGCGSTPTTRSSGDGLFLCAALVFVWATRATTRQVRRQ